MIELTGEYRFRNQRCGLFGHNVFVLQVEVSEEKYDEDCYYYGDGSSRKVKYFRDAEAEDLLELKIGVENPYL